jgi:hypothetical protein
MTRSVHLHSPIDTDGQSRTTPTFALWSLSREQHHPQARPATLPLLTADIAARLSDLVAIIRRLDTRGVNLVRLWDVRLALDAAGVTTRAAQDAVVQAGRRARLVSLVQQGRYGLSDEDRASAIVEDGRHHTYLSVRE